MKLKTLTVSQVNEYIISYVTTNPIFSNMLVSGEVTNLKKTPYGYTFFSLKDETSKINAITYIKDLDIKDGDLITVSGKISFFKKNGTYSLQVFNYQKSGLGQNYEKFRLLYEKLAKLGYFLPQNKKQIPFLPQNMGIITSTNGAAIKDIISVIERRFPKINIYIYDSKMQGEFVEQSVVNGIKIFNEMDIDVIIISRGGGDTDDLSAFNSELIAEAIFDSNIPIISAIGHEIDYLISDYVADVRAATPSIAAELSVPNLSDIILSIKNLNKNIESIYKNILSKYISDISRYQYKIQLNSPISKLAEKKVLIKELHYFIEKQYKKKIDIKNKDVKELDNKISFLFTNVIQNKKMLLDEYSQKLRENNYVDILNKGFAIVMSKDKVVKNIKQLESGEKVKLLFNDGEISATID